MSSSLFFSSSCRSSSNQLLKSYYKFSPIISSLYSYSQNQKPTIVSNLLSNRSFSSHNHDHDHKKKLLNPSTTSTWSFSDSTTLSKFLGSTQQKLLNPNPSFITSFSTCNYPVNKNLPKTYYTNFVSSNLLSNPCRNLGLLRSFSTYSSDKLAVVEEEFDKELREVRLNIEKLSSGLILLSVYQLLDGGMVWFQSFGSFAAVAFPLFLGCLMRRTRNQIELSWFDRLDWLVLSDKQDQLQILNRILQCVKMLNIFFVRTFRFIAFLLIILFFLILKPAYCKIQNRYSNKSKSE